MLNKKLCLKVSTVAAAMIASSSAFALTPGSTGGSGVLTFTGEILDAPCSIAPESADQTINMGQISNRELDLGGKSQAHPFSIKLENCAIGTVDSTTGKYDPTKPSINGVTVTFTGGTQQIDGTGDELFAITGSASGAGIAITDANGAPVVNGTPTGALKLVEGDNQLGFSSYMQSLTSDPKTSQVVPGDFQSVVNFTLTYS
ncbi:fimbrial protein [Photobacterium damselae]|uniref:fimbrial protein n=1 Tax=Photobacterium damselae TaxID=38293 RepID=UPI001B34F12F|nr:fimbrial protein [Photobacterium damselae]